MAGPAEAPVPSAGPLSGRPPALLLRQILHPWSGAVGRGVYPVSVLSSGQAGSGSGGDAVQREHGCPDGQLHCSSWMWRFRYWRLSRSHVFVHLQVHTISGSRDGKEDHGESQETRVSLNEGRFLYACMWNSERYFTNLRKWKIYTNDTCVCFVKVQRKRLCDSDSIANSFIFYWY